MPVLPSKQLASYYACVIEAEDPNAVPIDAKGEIYQTLLKGGQPPPLVAPARKDDVCSPEAHEFHIVGEGGSAGEKFAKMLRAQAATPLVPAPPPLADALPQDWGVFVFDVVGENLARGTLVRSARARTVVSSIPTFF